MHILKDIFTILNDILVIFFDLLIFTKMFVLRQDDKVHKVIMYSGCAVIVAAYFVCVYFISLPPALSSMLCMAVPSFILFFCLSKYRDGRFLVTFCFVDTVSLIIAFLGRWIGLVGETFGTVLSVMLICLLYGVILKIGNNYFSQYRSFLNTMHSGWKWLSVAALVIYFAMIFLAAYPKPLISRMEYMPSYLVLSVMVIMCYLVFVQTVWQMNRINEQNRHLEKQHELYSLAYTDALTGVYNYTAFKKEVELIEKEHIRKGSLCCMAFDLNEMKQINDSRGHVFGDIAIKNMAHALNEVFTGKNNKIFRTGGDEFAVILQNTDEKETEYKIGEFQRALNEKCRQTDVFVTAAAGYYILEKDDSLTLKQAFVTADQRMYEEKKKMKERERKA